MAISNLEFSRAGSGPSRVYDHNPPWGNLTNDQLRGAADLTEVRYEMFKDMSGGHGTPVYSRASSRALALVYQTAYGGRIVGAESPCGGGVNCSFRQSFVGPAYKCEPWQPRIRPPDALARCDSGAAENSRDDRTPQPMAVECERARALPNVGSLTMYAASNGSADGEVTVQVRELEAWMDGVLEVQHSFLPLE
jgi:hypothetical protein